MVLHVLLGLRAVSVESRDIISVNDREGDGFLRVRDRQGKSYMLSRELSDFEGLRETLGRIMKS